MEGVENTKDQVTAKLQTAEAKKGESKRHTFHFVGQQNEESQACGMQRRSLDISSSDTLGSCVSSASSTAENRQVELQNICFCSFHYNT